MGYVGGFLQMLLYLGIAPGVSGTLLWLKARAQGRVGPGVLQPYRDLWKLFHKQPVIPDSASWLFPITPWITFGCFLLLGLLIPIVFLPIAALAPTPSRLELPLGWPSADLLLVVYVLGLGRFALGLAGMDTGSPFGDLGGSREMFMHFLAETTLILSSYALAIQVQTTSLPLILVELAHRPATTLYSDPSLWLIILALSIVALLETGRIPFENSASKLELAMMGNAIRIEYSGYLLALLEWMEAMRLTFFMTMLLNLVFPSLLASPDHNWIWNVILILIYPLKLLILLILLTWWETNRAKARLRSVVEPALLALALSALAVVVVVLQNFAT